MAASKDPMTSTSVDWLSQEFLADPYPHYKALRESAPAYFDAERERWLLTSYRDVLRVLRDDVTFSARQQDTATSMLVSDPPDHTRLRTLVSKAFTPRAVSSLAPRIREIIDQLLDRLADEDEVDVISQFAYPLPITVIAEMLGVEHERRDFFRAASQKIAVAMGPITDMGVSQQAIEGRNELIAYFEELISRRRKEPRDDLVSALLQAGDSGERLTHGELLAMLLLLLVGGHETTVNLIANGLLALMRNRDQLELLVKTEGVERTAVEELLRYDAPVQYSGRIATRDVAMSGEMIHAGEHVRVILAAANRDPEMFPEPDRLELTRDPNPHVGFGWGIHMCLGAPLARLEGEIAIPAIARRFPNMRQGSGELRWRPASVLRGLEALPIRLQGDAR